MSKAVNFILAQPSSTTLSIGISPGNPPTSATTEKFIKRKQQVGDWEGFVAVNNENKTLINQLLEQNRLDPDLDFRGTTLLATAIHRNAFDIVKILLEHGANPNKKSNENDRYEPPVITATRLKHLHLVIILVKHGANLALTNFYGEDVIYQAVVANAFAILAYFLSTKSHGSCVHETESTCPIRRAIVDGEYYPSKRKCLLILLKYHYMCSCRLDGNSDKKYFTQILEYKNRDAKRELIGWIYLTTGINLNTPQIGNSSITNPAVAATNSEMTTNKYGQPSTSKLYNLIVPPSPPDFPPQVICLTNLVRITIRNLMSDVAMSRQAPFSNEIFKLPLPLKLMNFLLMNELSI